MDELQTVLLVDDEEDILTTLGGLLESALPRTRVLTSMTGARALEMLRAQPADLVMSDFRMPGMDGLQFLGEVRKLLPGVPRVLMTAFPETELAIRALNEERIQHFCTKPLDPKDTVEVVASLLAERLARKQREAALRRSLDEMGKRGQRARNNG